MGTILPISLKLNFTPNSLGCLGLIRQLTEVKYFAQNSPAVTGDDQFKHSRIKRQKDKDGYSLYKNGGKSKTTKKE